MPKSDHSLTGATVPESYRSLDSCANCKYLYWKYRPGHYCVKDGEEIPTLQPFTKDTYAIWEAWADLHIVHPSGICDEHCAE